MKFVCYAHDWKPTFETYEQYRVHMIDHPRVLWKDLTQLNKEP